MRHNGRLSPTVAADPETSAEDLLRCTQTFPFEVLGNPVLRLLMMSDPAMAHSIAFSAWSRLITNFWTSASRTAPPPGDRRLGSFVAWCFKRAKAEGVESEACEERDLLKARGDALTYPNRLASYVSLCSWWVFNKALSLPGATDTSAQWAALSFERRALERLYELMGRTVPWPSDTMRPNGRRT